MNFIYNNALIEMLNTLGPETRVFIVTIFVFTLVFHTSYSQATADKAPAFLTTLGILGTFIGIALGLRNFNTEDIQRSVPALIDGIKTAVWASAFGIFCALTVKLRDIEGFYKRKRSAHKSASVEELIGALRGVEQALLGHHNALAAASHTPAPMHELTEQPVPKAVMPVLPEQPVHKTIAPVLPEQVTETPLPASPVLEMPVMAAVHVSEPISIRDVILTLEEPVVAAPVSHDTPKKHTSGDSAF